MAPNTLVDGVGAGREFRRVGLGQHDRAGGLEPAHDLGILVRDVVLVERRAEGGADAGRQRDVLDDDRQARAAARAPRRASPRLRPRARRARACSAASVTMALSLGLTRAIAARCASSTSTGLDRARFDQARQFARGLARQAVVGHRRHLPDQWTKRRSTSRNSRLRP